MNLCLDCRHSIVLEKSKKQQYRVCKKTTDGDKQTVTFSPSWNLCINERAEGRPCGPKGVLFNPK